MKHKTEMCTVNVAGELLFLLPEKAIYRPETGDLILSDLHLGKSGHFRKHGIPAPGAVNTETLQRLGRLIDQTEPERLCILGDFFHSEANREWFQFEEWREKYPQKMVLVMGNHDLLNNSFYTQAGIETVTSLESRSFRMIHDREDESENNHDKVLISGHIHPAVKISGRGRQSVRVPCFMISPHEILLPAFGSFTGSYTIKPGETDRLYAVVDESILPINP